MSNSFFVINIFVDLTLCVVLHDIYRKAICYETVRFQMVVDKSDMKIP